jgi:hypothetical protein
MSPLVMSAAMRRAREAVKCHLKARRKGVGVSSARTFQAGRTLSRGTLAQANRGSASLDHVVPVPARCTNATWLSALSKNQNNSQNADH